MLQPGDSAPEFTLRSHDGEEVYLGEGLSVPTKTQRRLEVATVRKFKASDADIDPELRKQLEALGYFGE